MEAAEDNNERHEQLKRIRENLLPFYDDVSAVAPEVIRLAAEAIRKARDTLPIPVQTAFGDFDGRTAEQVATEALQLIDDLRYAEIEHTFHVLCDLYLTAYSLMMSANASFSHSRRSRATIWMLGSRLASACRKFSMMRSVL